MTGGGGASGQSVSVVGPCFNEEQVLPVFIERTLAVLRATGRPFELVLVDDGSTDRTWATIAEACRRHPELRGIRLRGNAGHQLALSAGLAAARGELIVSIDTDLQDPPELIPELITTAEREAADVVHAQRRRRRGEGPLKLLTAWLFYRVIALLSDVRIPPDTGDFRLMRREVVEILTSLPERHRFLRGLVVWTGGRQVTVLYDRDPRHAGATKYTWRRMLRFAADALTGFSRRPLAVATYAGFASAAAGVAILCWALITWAVGGTLPGWASLMAGLSLFASVQLFCLGVLGEYVGRLYEQQQGRPLYLVREGLGRGLAADGHRQAPGP